jgi:hypothetical protein
MASQLKEEEEEPALTEELRAVMRSRPGWSLLVLVLLAVALTVLAWVASRTVLSGLWN